MRSRVDGEIRAGHVPLCPSVLAAGIFLFSFNQSPQENCSRTGARNRAPGDAKSAKPPRKYLVQQAVCRGPPYSPRSCISHLMAGLCWVVVDGTLSSVLVGKSPALPASWCCLVPPTAFVLVKHWVVLAGLVGLQ